MSIQSIIRWFEIAKPKPTQADINGQLSYHLEEFREMLQAMGADSPHIEQLQKELKGTVHNWIESDVALLDALCDQIVTAIGVGVLLGYDMERAIDEVDTSNWTKFALDDKGNPVPYIRPDGKIGKNPETYQEPQLEQFIGDKE